MRIWELHWGFSGGKYMWYGMFMCVSWWAGQIGSKVGVLGVCWTWPPPGFMTCTTPGLRVAGQTSPFLRWAVNWPQGQSVRLEGCVSLCVCVCVWTSVPCDLICPDKATGPNNKNVYFLSLSLIRSLSLHASGEMGEVIKQNKPTGRMTSHRVIFWT